MAVFKLFSKLSDFVQFEKEKSSTQMLTNMIEEWESLFAREVNVVLFKSYYKLTHETVVEPEFRACYRALLNRIIPALELMDYRYIYEVPKLNHNYMQHRLEYDLFGLVLQGAQFIAVSGSSLQFPAQAATQLPALRSHECSSRASAADATVRGRRH